MKYIVMSLLMMALSACSTISISSDYDPQANFAQLTTYSWLDRQQPPAGDRRADNALLDKRVRVAVERALADKGFVKGAPGSADFMVGYHVTLNKRTSIRTLNSYYRYGPGWSRYYHRRYGRYGGFWGDPARTYVYEYDEGTLILDIVTADNRELIWRGSARDEVHFSDSPEEKTARIREAVVRMLGRFPPQ